MEYSEQVPYWVKILSANINYLVGHFFKFFGQKVKYSIGEKYQKKWCFWSKNDKFLFLLPFSQFLSNYLLKGLIEWDGKARAIWTPKAEKPQVNRKLRTTSRTWNIQGPISVFGPPWIFWMANKRFLDVLIFEFIDHFKLVSWN